MVGKVWKSDRSNNTHYIPLDSRFLLGFLAVQSEHYEEERCYKITCFSL